MSKNARENHDPYDRYYTPKWATRALCDHVGFSEGLLLAEPCAGEGDIVDVLHENGLNVAAGDIDPDSPYYTPTVDATNPASLKIQYEGVSGVVTNPPYNAKSGSASEVIKACRKALPKQPIFALLRLSFLEPTDDRAGLLQTLSEVLILPRVEFKSPVLDGGNNVGETSAWFGWIPHRDSEAIETNIVPKWKREKYRGQKQIIHSDKNE